MSSSQAPAPTTHAPDAAQERQGLYLVGLAVLFFSITPVLVRWAEDSLTPFEIAAGRMLSAGVMILAAAAWTRQPLPARRDWLRFVGFGLVAALHFGLFIASLHYTTIAHSLAITYTAPIFVALLSWWLLDEKLNRRQWLGTLVTVGGVTVLAGFEPALDSRMLLGDLLALGSAICYGLYSIPGRSQRHRYGLFAYAGTVYALAGVWLLPVALANFSAGGYTLPAVGSVLILGLLPLGLGHTLYNAALRRTPATQVNLIATQEVTGGVLLGILLLSEIPSLTSVIGGAIMLAGIALVIL